MNTTKPKQRPRICVSTAIPTMYMLVAAEGVALFKGGRAHNMGRWVRGGIDEGNASENVRKREGNIVDPLVLA